MITQQTAGAETQLRRPLSWVQAVACAAELRRWANIESEARDMKIGKQLFFAPGLPFYQVDLYSAALPK